MRELLRRVLQAVVSSATERLVEARLSKLESRMKDVEGFCTDLDADLAQVRSVTQEWAGVKGYSTHER